MSDFLEGFFSRSRLCPFQKFAFRPKGCRARSFLEYCSSWGSDGKVRCSRGKILCARRETKSFQRRTHPRAPGINDHHLPGVIFVSRSVHIVAPMLHNDLFSIYPREDGFPVSLAKCPSVQPRAPRVILGQSSFFSLERLHAEFLATPPLCRHYLRFLSSPRLPPRAGARYGQVWSLISQRGGKRSAGCEQRYRSRSLARSLAPSIRRSEREENGDLCETITRKGEIRPRWYYNDASANGYSRADGKIYTEQAENGRRKRDIYIYIYIS